MTRSMEHHLRVARAAQRDAEALQRQERVNSLIRRAQYLLEHAAALRKEAANLSPWAQEARIDIQRAEREAAQVALAAARIEREGAACR